MNDCIQQRKLDSLLLYTFTTYQYIIFVGFCTSGMFKTLIILPRLATGYRDQSLTSVLHSDGSIHLTEVTVSKTLNLYQFPGYCALEC